MYSDKALLPLCHGTGICISPTTIGRKSLLPSEKIPWGFPVGGGDEAREMCLDSEGETKAVEVQERLSGEVGHVEWETLEGGSQDGSIGKEREIRMAADEHVHIGRSGYGGYKKVGR